MAARTPEDIHAENVSAVAEDRLIGLYDNLTTDAAYVAYERRGGAAIGWTLDEFLHSRQGSLDTMDVVEQQCLKMLDWAAQRIIETRRTPVDLTLESDNEATDTDTDSDKDDSPPSSPEHYLACPRRSSGGSSYTPFVYDPQDDDEDIDSSAPATPDHNTERKRKKNALCLAPAACRTRTNAAAPPSDDDDQ